MKLVLKQKWIHLTTFRKRFTQIALCICQYAELCAVVYHSCMLVDEYSVLVQIKYLNFENVILATNARNLPNNGAQVTFSRVELFGQELLIPMKIQNHIGNNISFAFSKPFKPLR